MGQSAHVGNIAFSTAFLVDKIAAIQTGTFTAGAYNVGGYLYRAAIPHNLTRPAFTDCLFSTNNSLFVNNGNNDGVNSYECYSDASNFYLLTSANSGTIYYKMVATWIDNYDNTNPLIAPVLNTTLSSVNNTTNFDSRQNYQKIYIQVPVTVNNPGVGNTGSFPVFHNFGYIPNYKLFFTSLPGQVWPSIAGGAEDEWLYDSAHQYECWGIMDTSKLTVFYQGGISSAATLTIWYRIYFDS